MSTGTHYSLAGGGGMGAGLDDDDEDYDTENGLGSKGSTPHARDDELSD
jgi:hypothetical protein